MSASTAWLILGLGLGPLVGSFIGLLSLRLPQGRPVILGRSACPACATPLGVPDLVPILSFLALRGRCRHCRAPIPRRYLSLELACLCLAGWSLAVHPGPQGLAGAGLAWQLLLLAVLGARHFLPPPIPTLPLIVTGLAASLIPGQGAEWTGPAWSLLGAALGFLSLALLGLAYRRLRGREGLGGGDAYLLAGGGAWCGAAALPTILLIAAGAGLASVLVLKAAGRPMRAQDPVPFGVFLALGIWLTWLHGPLGG